MRWDSQNNRFTACYHTIANEEYAFTNGELFIKFTVIGADVEVHVNGGLNPYDALKELITDNAPAEIG
jgi:hypothetical protein